MPEDESLWKDDVAEVPHDKSDPPSQIVPAEAGPGHPKEQPKPVIALWFPIVAFKFWPLCLF